MSKQLSLILILSACIAASSAKAQKNDLIFWNILESAQISGQQFSTHSQVKAQNIDCACSNITGQYSCVLDDTGANNGQGNQLNLVGRKARRMFQLLQIAGAEPSENMGKTYLSAYEVACTQSDTAQGNLLDRTNCTIQIFPDQANDSNAEFKAE